MQKHSEPSELCTQLAPKLAGAVDGDLKLDDMERAHVDSCLRCQAEVVSYRKLLRAMHGLRAHVVQPAPGVLAAILARIGERAEKKAIGSLLRNRRIAYGGAVAIVAGAGVTSAILIAGRSKGRSKKAA